MSKEEKTQVLEQMMQMQEVDKAFVTGWAAGRLSMMKEAAEAAGKQGEDTPPWEEK